MGWGLLFAAAYGDRETFELIHRWTRKNLQVRRDHLFAWKLAPKGDSASTSNRNFEGRQGFGGRTHLVSPAMAAAAAIAGHFVDVRDW